MTSPRHSIGEWFIGVHLQTGLFFKIHIWWCNVDRSPWGQYFQQNLLELLHKWDQLGLHTQPAQSFPSSHQLQRNIPKEFRGAKHSSTWICKINSWGKVEYVMLGSCLAHFPISRCLSPWIWKTLTGNVSIWVVFDVVLTQLMLVGIFWGFLYLPTKPVV